MPVTFPILKAGAMMVWFILCFIFFFHLLKREVGLGGAAGLSVLSAFLLVMPFFGFNPLTYVEETRNSVIPLLLENLGAFILGVGFAASEFAFFWWLSRRMREVEEYRHVVHSLASLLIIYFAFVSIDLGFLFLCFYLFLFILVEYFRHVPMPGKYAGRLKKWIDQWLSAGERIPAERKLFMPVYFALAGMVIPMVFLSRDFALAALLVFGLGDPTATMVGRSFGKTKWPHNPKKSLEGSGAMLGVIFVVLLLLGIEPWMAAAVGVSVMLFESLPLLMSDNLVIPLIAGMVLVGLS